MPSVPITCSDTAVPLRPAPINPAWILDGTPEACNAVLSVSRDRTAHTLVWSCTPGRFEWHYDIDETIHILEGSVVLDDGTAGERRLGPGSVVFFPAGAVVRWTVETPVRKLAFFRRQLPAPVALATRLIVRGRHMLKRHRRIAGSAPARAAEPRAETAVA